MMVSGNKGWTGVENEEITEWVDSMDGNPYLCFQIHHL